MRTQRSAIFLLLLTPTIMLCASYEQRLRWCNQSSKDDEKLNRRLMEAVQIDAIESAKTLLEAKADANGMFFRTRQMLGYAKSSAMARLLLDHNAYVNGFDSCGIIPLHHAVGADNYDVAKTLLEHKAKVDYRLTHSGWSPLERATSAKLTRLLIEHKATVDTSDTIGNTPLHYAVAEGLSEKVRVLIEAKAPINAGNITGEGPLHKAIADGWKSIVKILIAAGADPMQGMTGGKRPIDMLVECMPDK